MRVMAAILSALMAGSVAAAPTVYSPPRTPWGAPDLEGFWSNASLTKLTRTPGQTKLVVNEAEAKALSAGMNDAIEGDLKPSDPSAGAPKAGGDPGGYNMFWLDPGRSLVKVNGEYRTSWIVDPADGQLPLSVEGRALVAKAAVFRREADKPVNPESLEPWDRCIIASRGSGGPGMLNNIYNSNYQIVQTPDAVAIVVEMIHDTRTIPLYPTRAAAQAAHGPASVQPWLGDAAGWWEGDTLVVETVHVNAEQGRAGPLFLTPQGRVTERFTRVAKDAIHYEFTVEDTTYYSRPWRAETTFTALAHPLYEYACHEGNYAMAHILAGARAAEGKRP
jgi:hypothetical protein